MGYRLNCLDEPVFKAVSKPLLTEFGIHHISESCVTVFSLRKAVKMIGVHTCLNINLPGSATGSFSPDEDSLLETPLALLRD